MIELVLKLNFALSVLLGAMLIISRLMHSKLEHGLIYRLYWSVPGVVATTLMVHFFEPNLVLPIGEAVGAQAETLTTVIQKEFSVNVYWIWLFGSLSVGGLIARQAMVDYQAELSPISISGFERLPVYVSSDDSSGPRTIGIFEPRIVLPRGYQQMFNNDELSLVLQHEWFHVCRKDNIANSIAAILLTVFWFNPLAWLVYREFRQTQEASVDEMVIKIAPQRALDYARALMKSSTTRHNPSSLSITSSYGDAKMIKRRMQYLRRNVIPSRSLTWLCSGIVAVLVFATGCSEYRHQPTIQEAAEPIVTMAPRYPRAAMEEGITNEVIVSYDLAADSSEPTNIVVVSIGPSAHNSQFEASAVWAMERFRFNPEPYKRAALQQKFTFQLAN